MKLFKLNQRGHWHILMPILTIIAVGGIGIYTLTADHAQTPGCAEMLDTFQYSKTPTAPYNKDDSTTHCVQYIQQMFNGVMAYWVEKFEPVSTVNSASLSLLGSKAFDVSNGFASVSDVYDSATTTNIAGYQKYMNYPVPSQSQYKTFAPELFGMTQSQFDTMFEPNGELPTDGTTGSKTWNSLCQAMTQIPAAAWEVDTTTDYTGANKTNMWYIRSYMRTGITAYDDAGCKSLPSTKTTSTAWNLTGTTTTTTGASSVAAGATITFKSDILNAGKDTATSFDYGARYFYTNTATPTRATNTAYAGEVPQSGYSVQSSLKSGYSVWNVQQAVTVPDNTTYKYVCGTIAFTPYNSTGAINGRSTAKCISISPTVSTNPSSWALTGTTSMSRSGYTVTFSSTIKNTGSKATGSFVYGPRYFYSSTSNPAVGSNGAYPDEVETVANKTDTDLQVGDTVTAPTQSITLTKVQPESASIGLRYLCGTVAFSTSSSNGSLTGRSKAVCILVEGGTF